MLLEGRDPAHLKGFRVLGDGGGDDGLDAYHTTATDDFIGNYHLGILQMGCYQVVCEDIQTKGHFRLAGYANVAKPREQDFDNYDPPYETVLSRCNFEGMRAAAVRGPDKFLILASTSSTVEVIKSDDHPFTTDGDNNIIRLTQSGTGTDGGLTYTYTGVEIVNVGGEDRVRLTGVERANGSGDPFALDGYDSILPSGAGGANSHIIFRDCQFGGLTFPSGHVPNDTTHLLQTGITTLSG